MARMGLVVRTMRVACPVVAGPPERFTMRGSAARDFSSPKATR
jgi:hypothetical protein